MYYTLLHQLATLVVSDQDQRHFEVMLGFNVWVWIGVLALCSPVCGSVVFGMLCVVIPTLTSLVLFFDSENRPDKYSQRECTQLKSL
jgi:hypothetical protein